MKKSFVVCILLLSFSFLFAAENTTPKLSRFSVEGSHIGKSTLTTFPLTIQCSKETDGTYNSVYLKCLLTLPDNWQGDVGLILYKNLMSCKVYVNDVLIDTIGRPGPKFFYQAYISRGVLIPASILQKENVVKFELWNDTGTYKLRKLDVTDKETYSHLMLVYNFLDIQTSRGACILLLFVALYSLFMFVNYKKKREFFHLSAASFFFAIYLLNISQYDSRLNYLLSKALLFSCFPASIFFVFHFFKRFFGVYLPKKIGYCLDGLGLIFIVGYYVQRNSAALDTWHSIMLIYPLICLLYGAYGFFKSLKKNTKRNISAGIGLFVCFIFSIYDMYNFLFDIMPYIFLQGLGFMGLIIGTFYSISQEIADTNLKCVTFATELEESKKQQDDIFNHIQDASTKADATGKVLNHNIDLVSQLVTKYIESIHQVNTNIEMQHEQVEENKENVSQIFTAIDKMSEIMNHHKELVDTTVTDVNNLTEGIHKTDSLIKKSAETIKSLTTVCSSADKEVADSSRFVDDLANYSKNIYEIVNSISDLSQQTNVLSINAAIEAARSGEAGKGFSVVAGEIRKLASQSGESANKISEILSTMVSKIENIQNQESLVSSRLKDVIAENTKTSQEIDDIFSVLQLQLEQSSHISSIINELMDTVHIISTQTTSQQLSGEKLNHSLEVLSSITDAVFAASKEQYSGIQELKNNLIYIKSSSDENTGVITELNKMITTSSLELL